MYNILENKNKIDSIALVNPLSTVSMYFHTSEHANANIVPQKAVQTGLLFILKMEYLKAFIREKCTKKSDFIHLS